MLEYNLTQRERQMLLQLIDLSQHSKEHFEAILIDPTAAAGPARELARLHFGSETASMEITKRDLRLLKDEGLIYFRWQRADRGNGRLSTLAFEAAGANFENVDADQAAAALAASQEAMLADERAIAIRFEKITDELVALTARLIDADESLAAQREARAIADELRKGRPDETIVIRKTKGFVSRLSLTFSGTVDLVLKGEAIGEFTERLSAWLVALSIWTDWHAVHYPPVDPCAEPVAPS